MKPIIIIPARKGSKGIPNKNMILLNGKPLIQYTIEAAMEVISSERIIVSTDSNEILKFSKKFGLINSFIRPAEFSSDYSGMYEVLLHACDKIKSVNFDYIILLQPTSPLRTKENILECIEVYKESTNVDIVMSAKIAKENPYFTLFEENKGLLVKVKDSNFVRRQDCPITYSLNGAIYIINKKSLLKHNSFNFPRKKKYIMNSSESIDIDTPDDLKYCEYILKNINE